ncbi:MAG: hypothetical protein PHP93_00195 [Kiritimatiellales bacterium]|nr:hypothetical protein [Kiritimatiellales bacterium]
MSIGFFTKGIDFELPHPPIDVRVVLLICRVFQEAWLLLKKYPPTNFNIQTAGEDTITEVLVGIIESRLRISGEVEGFSSALFGKVIRDCKITNFNKAAPDKMPDIFFDLRREHLSVLSEQDGLFVECKPVDFEHPVYSCYCKKGLIRFVNGDYAWAMQQALMVGYVKHPYSYTNLSTALDLEGHKIDLNTISHCTGAGGVLYQSVHDRTFQWLEDRGVACSIEVSHQWLPL